MTDLTLWHNPRCSKSRQALQLLREAGHDPVVRLYLKDIPSRDEIEAVADRLDGPIIKMVRPKEAAFKVSGVVKDSPRDDVIAALAAHPILIERPILIANGKAAIGTPPENLLAILS